MWFCNPIIIFYLSIDKNKKNVYNNNHSKYGEVAQLARAFGSYPKGHVFRITSSLPKKEFQIFEILFCVL